MWDAVLYVYIRDEMKPDETRDTIKLQTRKKILVINILSSVGMDLMSPAYNVRGFVRSSRQIRRFSTCQYIFDSCGRNGLRAFETFSGSYWREIERTRE